MQRGLDWYKREPVAFLGGVQGYTAKQIAVYTVILDLIYQHGGEINDDPSWVAGWIKDMGPAAVRNTISELIDKKKLIKTDSKLTQNRAKTEAKHKVDLSETRAKHGKEGGKRSGEVRKNKGLAEANASSKTEAEENRERKEERIPPSPPSGGRSPQKDFKKEKVVFEADRWFSQAEVDNLENLNNFVNVARKLNSDEFRLWCFTTNPAQPKLAATNALKKEQSSAVAMKAIQDRPKPDPASNGLLASKLVTSTKTEPPPADRAPTSSLLDSPLVKDAEA